MTSLEKLYLDKMPSTDKYDLGYLSEIYGDLLEQRRSTIHRVLEIGVAQGGSLMLWKDYFPGAEIFGCDIKTVEVPGVTIFQRDAYCKESVESTPMVDLLIDDGPHTFKSMCFFLSNYIQKVRSGGLAVLEDILDIRWTPLLLDLLKDKKSTVFHMNGKQKSERLLKKWRRGLDVIVVEVK